ncbi:MAG: alkaline phosphatase PhoX [Pyrinomonadaceae bacterium]
MSITPQRIIALFIIAAATIVGGIHISSAQGSGDTGPSSSASPYIVGTLTGVNTKSILTVGDTYGTKPGGTPYRLVGILDGIGAFNNDDGTTFTLLVNHELPEDRPGVVRGHGANGAFVTKLNINKSDLRVLGGEDLIKRVAPFNTTTNSFDTPRTGVMLRRLCSADLPPVSAFFNAATGRGFDGRIFMNGEEIGAEGKAYGNLLDGTIYELPRLGKFSWENLVANPATGDKTVVVGTDDSTPGQVYIYVGDKTNTGNEVERAGLNNGNLYGIRVTGVLDEPRATGIPSGTTFDLFNHGDVTNTTGAQLQAASEANNVTEFLRPEDGAWDPKNSNHFYFVTTDRFDTIKNPGTPANQIGRSRLWRLRFNDASNPTLGGQIDMLLDGTEPHQMFDNMTVTRRGQIFLQEDPGNQDYLAKLWRYNIAGDNLNLIAQHDPDRFLPGAPNFLTRDEESSGIIDAEEILGEGWFLLDVQAHFSIPGELVEGGQLLALFNPAPRRR